MFAFLPQSVLHRLCPPEVFGTKFISRDAHSTASLLVIGYKGNVRQSITFKGPVILNMSSQINSTFYEYPRAT